MAKTSLIINSTTAAGGKKLQKTLTDINPSATNSQLKAFAQQLNALTTNTYAEANRVDRVNCDTEADASDSSGGSTLTKQFRELTIVGAEKNATATLSANVLSGVAINPAVFYYTGSSTAQVLSTNSVTSEDPTVAKFTFSVPNSSGTMFVGITGNANFYSEFILVTVN